MPGNLLHNLFSEDCVLRMHHTLCIITKVTWIEVLAILHAGIIAVRPSSYTYIQYQSGWEFIIHSTYSPVSSNEVSTLSMDVKSGYMKKDRLSIV